MFPSKAAALSVTCIFELLVLLFGLSALTNDKKLKRSYYELKYPRGFVWLLLPATGGAVRCCLLLLLLLAAGRVDSCFSRPRSSDFSQLLQELARP